MTMASQLEQMKLMSQALMNSGIDVYEMTKTKCEQSKDLPLAKIRDRSGKPWCNFMCAGCMKVADHPTQFLQCSKCKAVKYCSRDCQVRDWKGKANGLTKPRAHKDLCSELVEANKEFQESTDAGVALRKTLFSSWADQHHQDGSFFDAEFKARRGILGRLDVGLWAQPCTNGAPYMTSEADASGFQNGQMLLSESFPTLKQGWKVLPEYEYPSMNRPKLPLPKGGVHCWKEYCQWRDIKTTSIAPLLLTNILTIYHMILHDLNLTNHNKKTITIYLLGVETELNYIPIFVELAFLLPGIDLAIIMVSPAAKAICEKAIKKPQYSKSILAKGFGGERHLVQVLDFQDPIDTTGGGGRVRVKLVADFNYIHESESTMDILMSNPPDAILGLNAGLGSYPDWIQTMMGILDMAVPFAFSDQTKLTFRVAQGAWMDSVLYNASANGMQLSAPKTQVRLNPFHGVINRDIAAVSVPNINNGYILAGNKK